MDAHFPLPVLDYFHVDDSLSEADCRQLLELRRLVCCIEGDAEFRERLLAAPGDRDAMLAGLGLALRAADLEPLWEMLERGCNDLSDDDIRRFERYPAVRAWIAWNRGRRRNLSEGVERWVPERNQRFFRWRLRQLNWVGRELGTLNQHTPAPAIVFELSKGCSVGCWFCALSAEKLEGHFRHTPENAALWREVLRETNALFGRATGSGALYHGTDPLDNPDYLAFLDDFHAEFAFYPQTTTAIPLRDVAMTRGILERRRACPVIPDRFSVLTAKALRRIHETFSPEDLKYVELVLHANGALSSRSESGRARVHLDKLRRSNVDWEKRQPIDQPTQASSECVCGFLVNMVERSIKLITPCVASDRWPLGYRQLSEGHFADAAGFRAVIEAAIAAHMPEDLDPAARVAFRPALSYEALADGFALATSRFRHVLSGRPYLSRLGQLIAVGDRRKEEIIDTLVAEGAPLFEVTKALRTLFERGLLVEADHGEAVPA